ncbi:MAG: hypothetical protein WD359_00555 [Dehalococcoidia bacterium]
MTQRLKLFVAIGAAVLIAGVAIGTILAVRTNSSSASEAGPSAGEVKAVLDAERGAVGVDATYEDDLYGFRLSYPVQKWHVTLGDSPDPHRIQLQTTGVFAPSGSPSTGTQPSAEITIQPYLSEPVSDARCEEPEASKVAGYPAFICAYSYGNSYKNFEPTPQEWSVISVTLVLDDGPVYISAAILKPLGEPDPSKALDALRSHATDVMEIIKSLEVNVQSPSS